MDIQIVEHNEASLQIIIKCKQIDHQILQLKSHIELFDNNYQRKKIMNYFSSIRPMYYILNPLIIVLSYIL